MKLNLPNENSCPHADVQCTNCDTCWVRLIKKEPTTIIGDRKGVVKMNDEKLARLNELSSKIKDIKAVLEDISILSEKSNVRIVHNIGGVRIPEELRSVLFTLLKDYHQKQLDILEKEFEEM